LRPSQFHRAQLTWVLLLAAARISRSGKNQPKVACALKPSARRMKEKING
jgi:hypothetical protein